MNNSNTNKTPIILLLLLGMCITYSYSNTNNELNGKENRDEYELRVKAFANCNVISLETMERISFNNPKYKPLAEFFCSSELENERKKQ